ncbi:MAG: hypothetical protein H6922_05595 [Pseudomonadaceae bacterium]|nr:hypothetical protein [Pseudomonadaceae bacterium]
MFTASPRLFRFSLWACLLSLGVPLAPLAQTSNGGWQTTVTNSSGQTLSLDNDYQVVTLQMKDLMNFNDCVKFETPKVKPFGKKCGPQITFKYSEPAAITEVTCRQGDSMVANSGMANMVAKSLMGTVKKEDKQTCQAAGKMKTVGLQTQWFFNAHVFGVSPLARLEAADPDEMLNATLSLICQLGVKKGRKQSLSSYLNAVRSAGASMASSAATATAGSYVPWGLNPAFISELPVVSTEWTTGTAGSAVAAGVTGSLLGVTGPLGAFACKANALGQDANTLLGKAGVGAIIPNFSSKVMDEVCVGTWGMIDPMVGYDSNEVRPVAAALVGYRGYKRALAGATLGSMVGVGGMAQVLENTKGIQQFNVDYPFINAQPGALNAAQSHKGSGCYNVGTALPMWYTRGEMLIPDPGLFFADLVDPKNYNPLEKKQTENGDFVFTYWKKTSCSISACGIVQHY